MPGYLQQTGPATSVINDDDDDDVCVCVCNYSVCAELGAADAACGLRKVRSPDRNVLSWLAWHQAASTSHVAQGRSRRRHLRSTTGRQLEVGIEYSCMTVLVIMKIILLKFLVRCRH